MKPNTSAKIVSGDSDTFTNFMRRLVAVPHAEIKSKLDAERQAKRTSKASSRASGASSKRAN